MHPLRVALFFFALFVLTLWANVACPDTLILAGIGSSTGVGEQAPFPVASLSTTAKHVLAEASWYGAHKIESGAGWGARGSAELRWKAIGLGASYTHRDGGAWTKQTWWLRTSLLAGPVRLVTETALTGYNHENKVEARVTVRAGALAIEPRAFVLAYKDSFQQPRLGYGLALYVGLAAGRTR